MKMSSAIVFMNSSTESSEETSSLAFSMLEMDDSLVFSAPEVDDSPSETECLVASTICVTSKTGARSCRRRTAVVCSSVIES